MKISELKQKSKLELEAMLVEKRNMVEELRFLLHQKKTKNVREISKTKKDVARILTILKN